MTVREPAVAGIFYPGERFVLQKTVQELLDQAPQFRPTPKAIVVPHAGFIYSGSIAASAYASLINEKDSIKKIVILGPAHTLFFKGIAYDSAEQFASPLGTIDQDQELLAKITDLPFVYRLPEAHKKEHSLEVQFPFCQVLFSKFTVLPLIVGETHPEQVAQLIERIWGNDDTLLIISSDLSHYLPYEIAQRLDHKTCFAIDTLNEESLAHEGACGYYPLRGFLHFARQKQLLGRLLDLRNSGDTAGEKDKVVGYASYHFYEDLHFGDYCKDELLQLAHDALALQTTKNQHLMFDYKKYNKLLQIRVPCFVTLTKNGVLRGCIGSLHSSERLGENVINNTIRAGFSDPRFPKVTVCELKDISVSVSILSPMTPITFTTEDDLKSKIKPGVDGVVLAYKKKQATFLPSVWEALPTPDEFLGKLKMKMGLAPDFWSPEMRAQRYSTEIIE